MAILQLFSCSSQVRPAGVNFILQIIFLVTFELILDNSHAPYYRMDFENINAILHSGIEPIEIIGLKVAVS